MRAPFRSILPRRTRAGLTLIEVMIAMTVMVIGLLSVFSAMNSAAETRDRARCQALAMQAIQEQIEIRQASEWNSDYAATQPVDFAVTGLNTPTDLGRTAAGRVTRLADSTSTIHRLRYRVDWTDRQGPGWIEIDFFNYNRDP